MEDNLMAEQVEEAARLSGFTRTYSCCDVPQKFCSADEWNGDLRAFGVALLRLVNQDKKHEDHPAG